MIKTDHDRVFVSKYVQFLIEREAEAPTIIATRASRDDARGDNAEVAKDTSSELSSERADLAAGVARLHRRLASNDRRRR